MPLLNGPDDVFAPRGTGRRRLKLALVALLGICLGAFSAPLLIYLLGIELDRAPAWVGVLLLMVPVIAGAAALIVLTRRRRAAHGADTHPRPR
jgi:MFS family permease